MDGDSVASMGKSTRLPWLKMLYDQGIVSAPVVQYTYAGRGTQSHPYLVDFIDNDPRDPLNFPAWIKWSLTQVVALITLTVSFISSAYASAIPEIETDLGGSNEINILGVSLFVLGFTFGPFLWAPLSELYGRQRLFLTTCSLHVMFNAVTCASQNLPTILILRFLAGIFGASPLTNAGGTIADMFPASERGTAMTVFAAAPFLGPVIGPVVGGFVAETVGWRWLEGVMTIFSGSLFLVGAFTLPETYAPVLLRRRASRLSKLTGHVYKARIDAENKAISSREAFAKALLRPWILLFLEPIVLLLATYQAIVFGTLYLLFAAYPIVFSQLRGWSQGVGGLAFLGVAVGMFIAIIYALLDNNRYKRACRNSPTGFAAPEARLPPCCVGGIAIPVGLFWFAWSNSPSVHWMASVAAGVPFGFGIVLMFLGIMNFLVDSYTIFAASVLAALAFMRALFAAIFPLFTTYMYQKLGIHWGSSIPAFLALACTPFPFILYKYGPAIRSRCRYSAEAARVMAQIRGQKDRAPVDGEGEERK